MTNLIEYLEPPAMGHAIRVRLRRRLRWCSLVEVEHYTRRDGASSFVLTWEDDKGYRYTSGLRSKSLTLMPHRSTAAMSGRG